jgi:hypothetical protein
MRRGSISKLAGGLVYTIDWLISMIATSITE